jgi:hypothetical protein
MAAPLLLGAHVTALSAFDLEMLAIAEGSLPLIIKARGVRRGAILWTGAIALPSCAYSVSRTL